MTRGRISGRTSSITAAFFQAITPAVPPTDDEVDEALAILGMSPGLCRCAYCGDAKTEWDHFRPTVLNRQPTGYITEIANLVPSCGKCNQSKGNKHWRTWMLGAAVRSPSRRGIVDLDVRISRLQAFEGWRTPTKIDYADLLGREQWALYLRHLETTVTHLANAQALASGFLSLASQAVRR
ncbi:HNH endonuclease [Pseudoxanthomonas sp. PXM01]|nr:HNH endonuclease [Pseudoxanthomonas sp. PXM01]